MIQFVNVLLLLLVSKEFRTNELDPTGSPNGYCTPVRNPQACKATDDGEMLATLVWHCEWSNDPDWCSTYPFDTS